MNAPFRRGACPGLSQPMPTGDGLLVRLTPTGATIRPEAFIALCAAARSCGNGVIEITSRGSIQVRGLTERSVERLAAMIGRIDLPVSDGPPVMCDCLAGLDDEEVLDAGALAAQLRGAIASASFIADLEPKVSVAVDGGGALHLDRRSGRCATACDGKRRTRVPSRECGRRCSGRTADRRSRVRACRRGCVADA